MNEVKPGSTRSLGQTARSVPFPLLSSLLFVLSVLLVGCSTDDVLDLGSTPGNQAAPRVAVVAHTGNDKEGVRETVHRIIEDQVDAKGSLDIRVMGPDGSAATMTKLRIGNRGFLGGDAETVAENDELREEYQVDAISAFDKAIAFDTEELALADLLDALRRAVEAAEDLDGRGNRRAILVSGGGAHRTPQLDLYADVQPADWGPAVDNLVESIGDTEVSIEIIGVAQFAEGTSPDLALTDRVTRMWDEVCQKLEDNEINCETRDER